MREQEMPLPHEREFHPLAVSGESQRGLCRGICTGSFNAGGEFGCGGGTDADPGQFESGCFDNFPDLLELWPGQGEEQDRAGCLAILCGQRQKIEYETVD
jgi:hypothetical protein